jgi:demethylmenaquinone methyltransferase / 2-methoxy-6-polyprenyl-1,4-benzoquinol methylase
MAQSESPADRRGGGKKEQVEAMFDTIAPRYDLLNRVLSLGIDQRWRTLAVTMLAEVQPKRILDVATGTATWPSRLSRSTPRR